MALLGGTPATGEKNLLLKYLYSLKDIDECIFFAHLGFWRLFSMNYIYILKKNVLDNAVFFSFDKMTFEMLSDWSIIPKEKLEQRISFILSKKIHSLKVNCLNLKTTYLHK